MPNVSVTRLAVDKLLELQPDLKKIKSEKFRLFTAKEKILGYVKTAQYISDSENGILLRCYSAKIDLIIKRNKVITLFPLKHQLLGGPNAEY